jgi:phage terminase large subunit
MDIKYTRIFERTRDSKAFVIINVGGARSGKSHAIAQLFISKLVTEEHKKFLICRKTFPSLRMSTMGAFLDLLQQYDIYREEKHNKTSNTYTFGTNVIQFAGLDESEKIKSTEFNYIWMEEGNEFTYEDYVALKLRLSGHIEPGEHNHMYISLNPVDANNWIATKAAKEEDVEVIKSTYKDNPFLSPEYIKVLEDLINQDPNSYRIYVLGEWGILEGKVYSNYKIIPDMPEIDSGHWAYGLDFGLVNPTAIVRATQYQEKFYVEELLYKSGLTNADIIEFFSHNPRGAIYGDPSAKILLEEIRRAGYDAYEGIKGVKESIDLVQRQQLLIPQNSGSLILEIQNYHWKRDKNASGDDVFLPEVVKFRDHAVDAMRYAIWGITERFGYTTSMPINTAPIRSLSFASSFASSRRRR